MSQPLPPPGRQPLPRTEWGKFIAGFAYAFQGLGYAFRTQRNIRVHTTIAVIAIILGIILRISALEFAMVFIAITSVFSAEMFNTVIELSIDLSMPEYHPLAKIAKDVAAGAVLFSAFLAIIIGLFVFGPHLWILIRAHTGL
jgi:diacylglycerol kinase